MKTYLVTGGAGFIGAALTNRLIQTGNKVVVIDNLSTGFKRKVPEGAVFIKGGCDDVEIIQQLYTYKFDSVFHIAGQSSGEVSFDDPVSDLQTNTQSTLLLLKLCEETGCKKFLYASSMAVYGDVKELPVSEDAITNPKSFYGVGKLASEHYLKIYSQFDISTAALRLFNVYGPGQNMTNLRQGMVSIFLAQAFENNHIHIKGSEDRFRDFIFIDDVVEAFIRAEDKMTMGKNYNWNVCTGQKTTVGQLVIEIENSFSSKISKEYKGQTKGDQFGIFGDNERICKDIGWIPSVTLKDGLPQTVQSLKENMSLSENDYK